MGRTGLILRQWVDRKGCYVLVMQAYVYDTGVYITSHTEVLCVFKFHNEWLAALCEARMSNHCWKARERAWKHYFKTRPKLSWWQYQKELVSTDTDTWWFMLKFLLFFGLLYFGLTWNEF